MILFRALTIKQVLAFSDDDLRKENSRQLKELRKWCSQKIDAIIALERNTVDDNDSIKILREQKHKLAQVRIKIDKINGLI